MWSSKAKFISAFSRALLECRIVPHFQPIVRLNDDTIVGFEVLARWYDPDYGNVSPSEFIPFAEKCDLLDDLLEGLMLQAMAAAQSWPSNLFLAFNISPTQLHDPSLSDRIEDIATRGSFPLPRVQIEVVETADLGIAENVAANLERLRDKGCIVSADDFGTGYSSLTWLRALPFSKIKIDTSFVGSMLKERESRKIVNVVIALGESLGLSVVAEGIEAVEQAALLRHMGCAFGQGYLFGEGVPADKVLGVLSAVVPTDHFADVESLSLERRAAQISSFYASPSMSLCFLDTSYIVVKASETFARRLGKSLSEVQGKHISTVVPASMNRLDYLRSFRVRGLPYPPVEVSLPTGGTDLVLTQAVRDEAGELLGFSLVGIDISAQKVADQGAALE